MNEYTNPLPCCIIKQMLVRGKHDWSMTEDLVPSNQLPKRCEKGPPRVGANHEEKPK